MKSGLDFHHEHSHESKIEEVLNVLSDISSYKQLVLILLPGFMTTIYFSVPNEIVKIQNSEMARNLNKVMNLLRFA